MTRFGTRSRGSGPVQNFVSSRGEADAVSTWTRPSEWLAMPDTSSGEKIAILMAVYNNGENYFSVTISGAYNIDWGDGTNTNYATGVKASADISYSAITTDTATQKNTLYDGYRQQLIVITPQGGSNLTSVNFNVRHSSDTRSTAGYGSDSQILDINMVGTSVTALQLTSTTGNSISKRFGMLQNFTYTGTNGLTDTSYLFINCSALRKVTMDLTACTTAALTFSGCVSLTDVNLTTDSTLATTTSMFSGCRSLTSIPLFDVSGVTSAASMFNACTALQSVPLFNWASLATTATSMFAFCTSLKKFIGNFPALTSGGSFLLNAATSLEEVYLNAPLITSLSSTFLGCTGLKKIAPMNTSAVTTFANAFQNCVSLKEIPWSIDFSSATTVDSMFLSCNTLEHVAPFSGNMGLVTTTNAMFQDCTAIESIPDLSVDATCTVMSATFATCTSLRSLPALGTTSGVTTWTSFASQCRSITTVPSYNFSGSTGSMSSMFNGCSSLKTLPDMSAATPTSTSGMFQFCYSLLDAPTMTMTSVTDASAMFQGCWAMKTTPSSYATSSATTVSNMFADCRTLQILPDVDTKKVSSLANGVLQGTASNTASPSIKSVLKTQWPQNVTLAYTALTGAELDTIYGNLSDRTARTVSTVTGNGTTVTYTTTASHGYQPGMTITVTGVSPAAYNLTSVLIASTPTATTFTVTNAATGTYTSGGTITPVASATINVTGSQGATTDTASIATTKGWTVTG